MAISIAIHETLAGLIPTSTPPTRRESVTRVSVIRFDPRPTPTPVVTPRPPIHTRRIAVATAVVPSQPPAQRPAPQAAIRHNAAPRPLPPLAHIKPVWDVVPVVGSGRGTGAGSGAGAGSLGAGGRGNGAGGGTQPCGYVTFSDIHGSRYDPKTHGFFVDIRMSVQLPDGGSASTVLDYPFYYPNEAANPWSARNRSNPDFPTLLQTPPPRLAPNEPALVEYVVQHSSPDGYTTLAPCS